MIKEITISSDGDYECITFSRNENENVVNMSFRYSNGCRFATFKYEDMKKAIEILGKEIGD